MFQASRWRRSRRPMHQHEADLIHGATDSTTTTSAATTTTTTTSATAATGCRVCQGPKDHRPYSVHFDNVVDDVTVFDAASGIASSLPARHPGAKLQHLAGQQRAEQIERSDAGQPAAGVAQHAPGSSERRLERERHIRAWACCRSHDFYQKFNAIKHRTNNSIRKYIFTFKFNLSLIFKFQRIWIFFKRRQLTQLNF